MHTQKRVVASVKLIGGTAVLGSYAHGLLTRGRRCARACHSWVTCYGISIMRNLHR